VSFKQRSEAPDNLLLKLLMLSLLTKPLK
jgi:hypothetical protein